jgi:hypothetical protein
VLVRALGSPQPAVIGTAVAHFATLSRTFGPDTIDRCIPAICAEVNRSRGSEDGKRRILAALVAAGSSGAKALVEEHAAV